MKATCNGTQSSLASNRACQSRINGIVLAFTLRSLHSLRSRNRLIPLKIHRLRWREPIRQNQRKSEDVAPDGEVRAM